MKHQIKMKLLPLLIGTLLLSFGMNAQTTKGFEWIRHHGDINSFNPEWIRDIQTDQAGNIYVGGEVNDIFVRDSNGNRIPSMRFSQDSIANYGNRDIWVAKYDPQGNLLWHRYAGSGADENYFDMITDQNGNTYISGFMLTQNLRKPRGFGAIPLDEDQIGGFIAKVDAGGRMVWYRTLGGDTISNNYFPYNASVNYLQFNSSGNLSAITFGGGDHPAGYQLLYGRDSLETGIHELEFDLNGNYLSFKSFDIPRPDRFMQVFSIEKNSNGAFISGIADQDTLLVGNDTILKTGINNAVVLAFDTNLNYRSNFTSTNNFDQFFDADLIGDTLVVAGLFNLSSATNNTVTFDTINHTGWSNESQAGGIFLFDANTTRLLGFFPSRSIGNNTTVSVSSAYAEKNGFAIGGSFRGQTTFSGTSNYIEAINRCTNCINTDLFFSFLDRNGNLIAEDVIYSSGSANSAVFSMHRRDSILYIGGFVSDSVQIAGVDSFITQGSSDAFLAAYNIGQISTSIAENDRFIKANNGILAYPNPTISQVNLMGKAINEEAQLFNISGQLVRSYRLNTTTFNQGISLEGLETGVYFLMIMNGNERQQLKIVKQ